MSEKRQREFRVTIRLDEAEHTKINERAENAGLTLSGYFRSAVLNTPPPPQSRRPPVDRTELAKLLAAMGRIGNNINQLARVANAGSWPESSALSKACTDIKSIRTTLMKALGVDPHAGASRGPKP